MNKLLKGLISFIGNLLGSIFKFLKPKAEQVVILVNAVKLIVNNPALDLLTALTQTGADDALLLKAREWINVASFNLTVVQGLASAETTEDATKVFVDFLKTLPATQRGMYWREFSGWLLIAASDGKLTAEELGEAIAMVQAIYAETKP